MTRRTTNTDKANARYAELKRILEERRREILTEVKGKMRDVRAFGASGEGQGVLDAAETTEADIQDDIELALIQMKSETLHKIEEALTRLDEKTYGNCNECGDEISERRLRGLPFAVRFERQRVNHLTGIVGCRRHGGHSGAEFRSRSFQKRLPDKGLEVSGQECVENCLGIGLEVHFRFVVVV